MFKATGTDSAADAAYARSKQLLEKELAQCKSTDELVEQFKAVMREVEDNVVAAIYQFREDKGQKTTGEDLMEMKKEMDRLKAAYETDKKAWREQALKAMCDGIIEELSASERVNPYIQIDSSKIAEAIKSSIFQNPYNDEGLMADQYQFSQGYDSPGIYRRGRDVHHLRGFGVGVYVGRGRGRGIRGCRGMRPRALARGAMRGRGGVVVVPFAQLSD